MRGCTRPAVVWSRCSWGCTSSEETTCQPLCVWGGGVCVCACACVFEHMCVCVCVFVHVCRCVYVLWFRGRAQFM